jgi:hypothetical protein
VPDVERELDGLYALPADEFTDARNELAKRLRAAGQRDEADEIKALRRPTAPAALVNRLARESTKDVKRLLKAGDDLRKAHGKGGAALRTAAEAERDAVDALLADARDLEPDASDATLMRVASTLRAAAADARSRPLLERGRLETDVEPQGFEALAGMSIAPPPKGKGKAPAKPKPDRRKLDAEKAHVRELREQAAGARRAASEAAREADRVERELAKAEERLRKLEES